MTKVVYNNCYGGFGLSHAAIMRYAELKSITLYPKVGKFRDFDYYKDSNFDPESYWYYGSEITDRTDPALVQVVEELGDAANDNYAKLVIEDIPAGTRYRILEYDGNEWIETDHSIDWSVA
jgi:hypothetical protein